MDTPKRGLLSRIFMPHLPENDAKLQADIARLSPEARAGLEMNTESVVSRHAPLIASAYALAVAAGIGGLQYATGARVDMGLMGIMLGTCPLTYLMISGLQMQWRHGDVLDALLKDAKTGSAESSPHPAPFPAP